jgi:hypothetical protein
MFEPTHFSANVTVTVKGAVYNIQEITKIMQNRPAQVARRNLELRRGWQMAKNRSTVIAKISEMPRFVNN